MNVLDLRQAWRLWSVRVSALGTILMGLAIAAPDMLLMLWNVMPVEIRARVPAHLSQVIAMVLFASTIVARLMKQRSPEEQKLAGEERQSLRGSTSGKATPKVAGGLAAVVVAMIASVIAVEGGYVNHPADPGGETHMGITKVVAVQNGYTGPMRTLPRAVAESIYYDRYLVGPGYAPLITVDAAVTEELFDTTVNMGPARPSRWYQLAINAGCGTTLVADGRVGPATIAAYRACQARVGAAKLCVATLDRLDAQQRAEYARLVRVNPKLGVFHKGWVAHRVGNVDRRKCAVARAA